MLRRFRSTTARLTALLFAAIAIPALATLGFMHLFSARALRSEESALISGLREDLIAEYEVDGIRGLEQDIRDRIILDPHGEFVLVLVDDKRRIRAGNLARLPERLPRVGWMERSLERIAGAAPEPVTFEVTSLPNGWRLLTGHFETSGRLLQQANTQGLLLAGLLTLPLALGLTVLLLALVERRVRQIAGIARRVGSGDLSRRVESDGSGDAFDRLSQALNAMLAQVETLVEELRLVTDGLAHDLRSPITRLEVALDRAATAPPDSAGAALASARAEAASLQAMLTTALQISRAEAGIGRDRLQEVDVRAMLEDVAEIYGPAAEDAGFAIGISTPEGLKARLHRELMGQALSNLIDNATRYAVGGSRIDLAASVQGDTLSIEVRDDGAGIAAGRRAEALRRFGRLDPARNVSGSGLGLALVVATARLHGGSVELDSADPGLIVRMQLPRDPGKD